MTIVERASLLSTLMLRGDVEIEPQSLADNNNSPLQERYAEDPGNWYI